MQFINLNKQYMAGLTAVTTNVGKTAPCFYIGLMVNKTV